MKRNTTITICILVTAIIVISGLALVSLNNQSNEIEDILYPTSSLIYAESDNGFSLAQDIDYEMSLIGNNSYEMIGSLSDVKRVDGNGFGFRINWTDPPYPRIYFAIVLKIPCSYLESENDFTAEATVLIKHNGTFNWHFNVIVSQLIFYNESVTWDFEKFGEGENETSFSVSSDLLDNASYFIVRDEFIDVILNLDLPLENGYITDILVDYASIKVWKSRKS